MRRARPSPGAGPGVGFSLMEVVIALAVIAAGLAGLAPILVQCTLMLRDAAAESRAVVAAASRLEELHALVHEQRATTSATITDQVTDLAAVPPGRGGTGLSAGDAATSWRQTTGYADGLRADGSSTRTAGEVTTVRRWAVSTWPGGGAGDPLLVLVFAAAAAREAAGRPRDAAAPRPGDVWLFGLRVRTLR